MSYEHTQDGIRVRLDFMGEGLGGDYDSEDAEDTPLYRCTVAQLQAGRWTALDHGSWCTNLSTAITAAQGLAASRFIWSELAPLITGGQSIRFRASQLSWLSLRWAHVFA